MQQDVQGKVDSRAMREVNRSIVLDIIRRGGRVSRTDLARRSTLTKPTVSAIVEDLLARGIVQEVGFGKTVASGGRRARLLEFNDASAAYLGIALGVNTTTVLRRLDALEARLGARLFERSRQGYVPTESGALLLEQARRMADQADEIERRIQGRDRELTGQLRVTTAFVVMEHLLPEPLAAFARDFPGIEVEVLENAFAVVLEGTAHLPMLESPERFDPLLLEFLEALSGGGEDAGDD